MLHVEFLRSEYKVNPIDLCTAVPRFSWRLASDKNDVLQKAYHIQVSDNENFHNPLWDSGEILEDRSVFIPYSGPALKRATRYYWHVRVTDNDGETSRWSESAWFEHAVLATEEWGDAVFITGEGEVSSGQSAGMLLRKIFHLETGIEKARLYITAKGLYEPWCNGQRVTKDVLTPGWTEYNDRLLYQTYDLTPMLREGTNTLGAIVGPGWYKGDVAGWLKQRNVYGKRTALIARLEITLKDQTQRTIITGPDWETSYSPVEYAEIYHGELYDARKEIDGWSDGSPSNAFWRKADIESTERRMLCPQDGVPVREHEVFKAKEIITTTRGDKVLDFGQNIAGWVRFNVSGKANSKVRIRHAEMLDAEGNFYTDNLRGAKQMIEYILRGSGLETYSPRFTFQGFRYICIDEWPGVVDITSFEAVAVYSDMALVGSFRSSSKLLNKLVSNVSWGMKSNFVDVPTDCPQRDERLGWTGDAQIFVRTSSYLMDVSPFFRKWMRDVSAAALPDGGIPHVVPNVLKGIHRNPGAIAKEDHSAAGWGDAIVVIPWTIYQYFGDEEILREQYPAMKAWVERIRANSQNGLIWNTGFHFGDWVALDAAEGSFFGATPNDLVATAFYAHSTSLLADAAQTLGYDGEAQIYRQLLHDIKEAYRKTFFTPGGELTSRTQTAYILSLVFDLVPNALSAGIADTLAKLIREKDTSMTTGFLGTPFICHALSDHGYLDLAYQLLLKTEYPSWLYQITKGATTIWEHLDGLKPDGSMWSARMNSFNHYAYGAVADWVFSVVCGLDSSRKAPAFKEFVIAPRPGGGLTFAGMEYESAYGRIAVDWDINGETMTVSVNIPPNTHARVILPRARPGTYAGKLFQKAAGGATVTLGSGEYRFQYTFF